jgi:hypothetical protein
MALRRRVHDGTALTNAFQDLLTFNANLVEGGALVKAVHLSNQDAASHVFSVSLVPTGGAQAVANTIEVTVAAHTTERIGPFWTSGEATVKAKLDANVNASARVTAFEEYATS